MDREVEILWPSRSDLSNRDIVVSIGRKAAGLIGLPEKWRPPLFVLSTKTYAAWKLARQDIRRKIIQRATKTIIEHASKFDTKWNAGLILRSSASGESLADRGAYDSKLIPADYDVDAIRSAIEAMYLQFNEKSADDILAIIIQPLVPGPRRYLGHISNERRVSKTVNHWMLESPDADWTERFNSQRSTPASGDKSLLAENALKLLTLFKAIGRWCTELEKGPCHIEWVWCNSQLWLLQIDFEDESPDEGVDPRQLIRPADTVELSKPKLRSLQKVELAGKISGWPKIDKIRELARVRSDPYPNLYFVRADRAIRSTSLVSEIRAISNGRIVCRTDCRSKAVEKLNLPRTNSVSPEDAVKFMKTTARRLVKQGASPRDICFILHRFIPATSAAWVLADPKLQIVRIDSLWGIPDGLQFLPHDTFQFDVRRKKISSETYRYKVSFIQESENGSWREIKISRHFGRATSLSAPDVREVAMQTHRIASDLGEKIQVMWFCGIPAALKIGRNLPWFRMEAPETKIEFSRPVAPVRPRIRIRTRRDLEKAKVLDVDRYVLIVQPDVELIRDDDFLKELERIALAIRAPVELYGSVLAHAYYMLTRGGVTVVAAGEPQYSRVRGRRVFAKLVRDEIPREIASHGEQTVLAQIPRQESRIALATKLFEETYELLNAHTPPEVEVELADLLEIIRSLASVTGINWEDVQAKAEAKRRQRGGFEKGLVLLETAWPKPGEVVKGGQIPKISLKDLAKSRLNKGEATFNFAALLLRGSHNRFYGSDGVAYEISLTGEGLKIRRVAAEDEQLPLPGLDEKK